MWGIFLNVEKGNKDLYQTVVEYVVSGAKALVISPVPKLEVDIEDIKALHNMPEYLYGEKIRICKHNEPTGLVVGIYWNFKKEQFFYKLSVNGRVKSKRYYNKDLQKLE
ncbi:MAG: hypothetical protein K2N34_00470 [Lachnospiraceae bacterium]|nr:hypothetical protein [Lachnospiraceae bacterium]